MGYINYLYTLLLFVSEMGHFSALLFHNILFFWPHIIKWRNNGTANACMRKRCQKCNQQLRNKVLLTDIVDCQLKIIPFVRQNITSHYRPPPEYKPHFLFNMKWIWFIMFKSFNNTSIYKKNILINTAAAHFKTILLYAPLPKKPLHSWAHSEKPLKKLNKPRDYKR